jgi:hypothetical protein
MNLLKETMPTPLFCKQFEDISKVPETKMHINNELLWILKDGYTIASIGLHSQKNLEKERGKSSLLNEIFPVYFEKTQNKHPIIKNIPFIAIRVLKDLCPLHVIDIPHDCPDLIAHQILKNSNIIILHSWQDEAETEEALKTNKQKYNIPIICLLRDRKLHNCLNSLDDNNIMEERPQ